MSDVWLSVGRHGTATDEVWLGDHAKHFIAGGEDAPIIPGNGTMEWPLWVTGGSPSEQVEHARAITRLLVLAQHAVERHDEANRVTLAWRQNDETGYVYIGVRGGRMVPGRTYERGRWHYYRLILDVDHRDGWPVGEGDAVSYPVSGTLVNGSAVVLVDDVPGDLPARVKITLVDNGTLPTNRFRISRRSGPLAAPGAWTPVVDLVSTGSFTTVPDGSAIGGSYVGVSNRSSTALAVAARATMPAGALNSGRFHVFARAYDDVLTSSINGTPSVSEVARKAFVRQSQHGSGSGSGSSISASLTSTQAGSTLVCAAKASKIMPLRVIATITPGTKTTFNTVSSHFLADGDQVLIEGVQGSNPDVNGVWTVDVIDADTFTIDFPTSEGGTGGTVRETFFETFTGPSGFITLSETLTTELVRDSGGVLQTKLVTWYLPNAPSRSGTQQVTFSAPLLNRAIALLEIANADTTTPLDMIMTEASDMILTPQATQADDAVVIGIAATNSVANAAFSPGFGFEERSDTGGLVTATKLVQSPGVYPWRANPSSQDPVASALLAIASAPRDPRNQLQAGTYSGLRAQAVDLAGTVFSTSVVSGSVTLNNDHNAFSASWNMPTNITAANVSHFRVVFTYAGETYVAYTTDNTPSITIRSLDGLARGGILPTSRTRSKLQARVGVSGGQLFEWPAVPTLLEETWHLVYLGTFDLPPVGSMRNGQRPGWEVQVAWANGGGTHATIRVDGLFLLSADEPGLLLEYPGLANPANLTWVYEVTQGGEPVAWVEDGNGSVVGAVTAPGVFTLEPGDNLIHIVAEGESGECSVTNSQFTFQVDVYPVYWFTREAS